MVKPSIAKAYSSQLQEVTLDNLAYNGNIPDWLSGSFISVGPAQFEVGETKFKHWIDGFAMLKKFTFAAGKVNFQSRFLHSEQYVKSNADQKLYFNEFATYAQHSWLAKVTSALKNLITPEQYDNCNVNTIKIDGQLVALTETSRSLTFDKTNLNTLSDFKFNDNLQGQMTLAHPHIDIKTGDIINITTEIGSKIKYHIYKVAHGSRQRTLIKTFVSDEFFYMHSFSITPSYIILFKSPLICNKYKLMFGLPFNDTLSWQKNKSSSFIIINRADGKVTEIETDAFICLHSVNAFELGSDIVLDLVCYENNNPYDELYLSNLLREPPLFCSPALRRYTVNLKQKECKFSTLGDGAVEFPRINYLQANGYNYQFAYTTLMINKEPYFFNALQKINVNTGKTQYWYKDNYYVGEAIFVKKPNDTMEDDGVLLFIAFNSISQCSALIILEAKTMQQMAEVALPFHLPFGLHGNFY